MLKDEIRMLNQEINLVNSFLDVGHKQVSNSLNCIFSIDRDNWILNLKIPAENFDKFKNASLPISYQEDFIRLSIKPFPIVEFHDRKICDNLFQLSNKVFIYRHLVTSEKGQSFVARREWSPTTTEDYKEREFNEKCFLFISSLQHFEDKHFWTNPILSCKDNQSINLSNFNRN